MGALAVLYTTLGGVVAVTWTEFPQMIVMTFGLFGALSGQPSGCFRTASLPWVQ